MMIPISLLIMTVMERKKWPFNNPHYVILNLAIGGNWGGAKGIDNSAFPMEMEVDFVRVFKKNNVPGGINL